MFEIFGWVSKREFEERIEELELKVQEEHQKFREQTDIIEKKEKEIFELKSKISNIDKICPLNKLYCFKGYDERSMCVSQLVELGGKPWLKGFDFIQYYKLSEKYAEAIEKARKGPHFESEKFVYEILPQVRYLNFDNYDVICEIDLEQGV